MTDRDQPESPEPTDSDQAQRAFDDAPSRFRDSHEEDRFIGSSGVLFEQAMAQTRMAICLTDPCQDDNPIVFANRAFRTLTGYEEGETLGRNCRFLQGPETDPAAVSRIRTAVENEDVVVVELLNYRKDGSTFWNALHIGPIYGDDGKVKYLFGSQWDVTDVHAARADEATAKVLSRELSHRVKNLFAVVSGVVTATARGRGVPEIADEMNERIAALGRAYETTLDDASIGRIDVGQTIHAVLRAYDPEDEKIVYEGNGVKIAPTTVATLGLVLHELATNAYKHGSFKPLGGTARVAWRAEGDERDPVLVLVWEETGGPAVTEPASPNRTSGLGLVRALLRTAGGTMDQEWLPTGLRATVRLPASREAD